MCVCHIYLPFVFIYLKSHEFFEQSIRDVADLLAVRDFDVVPMWEREREREREGDQMPIILEPFLYAFKFESKLHHVATIYNTQGWYYELIHLVVSTF